MALDRYDRRAATEYAARWAHGRNPEYADFSPLGGDCTNFVSQCLFAGCGVMDRTRDVGWYYRSMADRAPAWSGVRFLHRFLLGEGKAGPVGEERPIHELLPGDVIFLSAGGRLYHSLLVVRSGEIPYIAAHTADSWMRPASDYGPVRRIGVHILGVRRRGQG